MFSQEKWDNNEWQDADDVQAHFGMTFKECIEAFGFCRTAEWCRPPLNGQNITCRFRKSKPGND